MNRAVSRFLRPLAAGLSVFFLQAANAQDGEFSIRIPVRAAEHAPLTTNFDFGTVIMGAQPSRGFTFTNRSAKRTTLGVVQPMGKARVVEHNCTGTLEPSQTCTLTLALQTDTLGVNAGSVSVSHSEAEAADLYNLTATAVTSSAVIRFDEPTVKFGSQLLRSASQPRVLTLRNTGAEPVELDSVRFARTTSHYQLEDSTCEGVLPAGGSCTVSVVFRPQALGPLSASLSYVLSDGTTVNAASLLGSGVQGVPLWSTSELSFTDVVAGQESAPKTATLTNTGLGPLGLTSLELKTTTGDSEYFWISQTTCGSTLLPGASCQVSVKFSAPDTSFRNATLELQATGTISPVTRVQLWARPLKSEALLQLEPASLLFGDVAVGQPKTLSLTLRSAGQLPVTVSSYALSGVNASDFSLLNPSQCVGTLNPGMQCEVQVRAQPGAAGTRVGALTLTHSSSQPVPTVALSANGLLGELQVMPSSLSFAPINRGATAVQSLELKNSGASPLRISSLALASTQAGAEGMFLAADTCTSRELTAGASCTVQVTYAPTTVANHSAVLTVNHTGNGGSKAVPLSGSASEPPAALAVLGNFTCPSPAPVGAVANCSATLSNPSTVAYTVTGVGTSSSTSFVPSFVGCASGATLSPGQSCTVRLSVTPTAAGTLTTTYRLTTSAGALAKDATLLAQAPLATLTTVSHGNVQIGSSANATHKLANTGSLPVSLTMPATLSAGGSTAFSLVSHTCPTTLAVGASCDIVTRCAPASAGSLTRALTVASDSSAAIAGTLSCQGLEADANAGLLTLTPNPVSFVGSVLGGTGPAVTVTLKNNNEVGAKAVSITGASFAGAQASAFSVSSSTCYSGSTPGSLASGATCTLTLTARPTIAGLNSGVLQLGNSLGNALQLPLSVNGLQAAFSVTPRTQDFGSVTAGAAVASRSFTVTNSGSAAGSVAAVTAQSGASPIFKFTHNCPPSLPAGASCAVNVAIDSVASASRLGSQAATAAVSFTAGPAVTLSALANLQPAPVAAGSVSLTCPATAAQGQALSCEARVTSTGNTNLAVTSWGAAYQIGTGAWTALTPSGVTCSSTGVTLSAIPAGQFCKATVSVTPNTAGTYGFRLVPTGSAAMTGAFASVSVQGPSLNLTATNHPDTQVGVPSTVSHTLTNTGPVSVTLTAGSTSLAGIAVNRSACTTLAPGQSCTVTTTCSFSTAGAYSAVITLAGSPTVSTSATVACSVKPGSVAVSALSSPTTTAGGFSTSGNWMRVTNTGAGPVTLQAFYPATGWALVGNPNLPSDCVVGKVLQPAQSCVVAETLTGSLGPGTVATGTQRLRTSVGDSTWATPSVALKGLSLTPLVPFGAIQGGDNVTATYTVTNLSPTATAQAIGFAVSGTGLSVVSNTCPVSLASGASCQVTVRVIAPLTANAIAGSLTATTAYNAVMSGQEQPSTARSGVQGSVTFAMPVTPPKLSWTPGVYPSTRLNGSSETTSYLRNDGVGPVTVSASPYLSANSAHSIVSTNCPGGSVLYPGQSCEVVTRFAPVSATASTYVTLYVPLSVGTYQTTLTGNLAAQTDTSVAITASPVQLMSSGTTTFTTTVRSGSAVSTQILLTFGVVAQQGASVADRSAPTCTLGATLNSSCSISADQATIKLPANAYATITQTVTAGPTNGQLVYSASALTPDAQDTNEANNTATLRVGVTDEVTAWTPTHDCGAAPGAIDYYGRLQCNILVSDAGRGGTNKFMFLQDPSLPAAAQKFSTRPMFEVNRDWNYTYVQGGTAIDVAPDGTIYTTQLSRKDWRIPDPRDASKTISTYTHWLRHVAIFDKDGRLIGGGANSIDYSSPDYGGSYAAFDAARAKAYVRQSHNTICAVGSGNCFSNVGTFIAGKAVGTIPLSPTGLYVVDEVSGELVFVNTTIVNNDTVIRYNMATNTSTYKLYSSPLFTGKLDYAHARVRGNTMFYAGAGSLQRIDLATGVSQTLFAGAGTSPLRIYPGPDGVYLPGLKIKATWN